jgi:GNAT superfamily N-acetyltransferase
MITCQVETMRDTIEELKVMFPVHHEELGLFKDKMPLDPRYEDYEIRENNGQLLLVTVREDAKIIAYWVSFIVPSLHYQTTLANQLDIFWVHPDHRGNKVGFIMAAKVKEESIKRGVKVWYTGSKNHKESEWFFKLLGFDEVEKHYAMWIG